MKTVGLDLSLTSTGAAFVDGTTYRTERAQPRKLSGHERLDWLLDYITGACAGVDLVVIEGPSYGNQGTGRQTGHHERAGLWWLVTHHLWTLRTRVAVVPPALVKRYATGKGNAGKDDVLTAVVRRYPEFMGGNDEADALILAALGAHHLGQPLTDVPKTHAAALDAITWPTPPTPPGPPLRTEGATAVPEATERRSAGCDDCDDVCTEKCTCPGCVAPEAGVPLARFQPTADTA